MRVYFGHLKFRSRITLVCRQAGKGHFRDFLAFGNTIRKGSDVEGLGVGYCNSTTGVACLKSLKTVKSDKLTSYDGSVIDEKSRLAFGEDFSRW